MLGVDSALLQIHRKRDRRNLEDWLAGICRVVLPDPETPLAGEYDLVVANILSNPLRVLAPAICGHVRSGGRLALSGILREQAEEIIGIYAQWLPMQVAATGEDWICLSGIKP